MPRGASFGKDPGLQARMVATLFALGLLYVVFAAVLVAALLAIAAPALQGLFEQAIQQVQPRR